MITHKTIAFGIRAWHSLAMAKMRATAATNEALASLRHTSNHNAKDIQEMRTIQEIHTHTLNEMNQQLALLL